MTAEVGLAFGGIHQSFTTRNTHVPGREVQLKLVDGPFSNLDGVWKFQPVGDEGERACRVELNLSYGFSNFALAGAGRAGVRQDRLATWSRPSSSAPSRSTASRLMLQVTRGLFAGAARGVRAGRWSCRDGRDRARCGAGQRLAARAARRSTGHALTPGIWGRAVDWDAAAARRRPGRAVPAAHGRPEGGAARALPPAGRARHRAVRASRRKGGKAGY